MSPTPAVSRRATADRFRSPPGGTSCDPGPATALRVASPMARRPPLQRRGLSFPCIAVRGGPLARTTGAAVEDPGRAGEHRCHQQPTTQGENPQEDRRRPTSIQISHAEIIRWISLGIRNHAGLMESCGHYRPSLYAVVVQRLSGSGLWMSACPAAATRQRSSAVGRPIVASDRRYRPCQREGGSDR
jgi:hypothetical protein